MLPPVSGPDPRNPNLGAALAAAAHRLPPHGVEQVWVFPPRQAGAKETGLAVLVVRAEPDAGKRRSTIYTLRYEAVTEQGRVARSDRLEEQGTVPEDRVGRIIDGVVRRLEGDPAPPDIRETAGDAAAWRELLAGLGTQVLDPANQE